MGLKLNCVDKRDPRQTTLKLADSKKMCMDKARGIISVSQCLPSNQLMDSHCKDKTGWYRYSHDKD